MCRKKNTLCTSPRLNNHTLLPLLLLLHWLLLGSQTGERFTVRNGDRQTDKKWRDEEKWSENDGMGGNGTTVQRRRLGEGKTESRKRFPRQTMYSDDRFF